MNSNIVIAIVVLVALFGCGCGWLYSLRWRSEVRERLFEASATLRIRRLGRGATQPRLATEERSRGQPPPSRPPRAKGGPENKGKKAKGGGGKKQQPPKPKRRSQQQESQPQGWSPDNQQHEQENTDTDNQDQAQDQGSFTQEWGSSDGAVPPETNQSMSTTTVTTAADGQDWGSVDNAAAESSGQASGSENEWQAEGGDSTDQPAGSTSGWSAEGTSSSAQGDRRSNASGGPEWNADEKRADDHPEQKPDSAW
ncbi:hypothetical protein N8T08_010217 [Aspergillus melleus]|uniref:Uncharacterized protein n=1 Tax=Aspergillus melleus TaxID=138277 RepID=A0ACC3AS49_9EURO|nr:hypothetical protein N8T08_010217 [Aspergillus melleus]